MATASNSSITTIRMTFGQRLDSAAHEAGAPLQQEKLAEWLKEHDVPMSGAMINKYRNKGALPRIKLCRDMALALEVTVEWLYTGRGLRYPGPPLTDDEQEIIHRMRAITDPAQLQNWIGYARTTLPEAPRPNGQRAA